jgi:hypothetical protein
MFFFAARLFFDFPQGLPPLEVPTREVALEWVAKCFLFAIDVVIFIATARLYARFVSPLTPAMPEPEVS